jgi:hypothetical protein
VECGPITVPVSSTPFNACTGSSGCTSYCPPTSTACAIACTVTESNDACLSPPSTKPSYDVLVINIPEDSIYAPGEVFTFTPDQIACAASDAGCVTPLACTTKGSVPNDSTCIRIPAIYDASGAYVVPAHSNLSTLLGNPSTVSTTVPTQTSYLPVWTLSQPCAPPCSIEASLLNLPLPTVFAVPFTPVMELAPGTFGPEGTDTTGWSALLPALSSGYVQLVNFTSPFDTAFPPLIQQPAAQLGKSSTYDPITVAPPLLSPPPSPTGDTITISSAEALSGWSVFLRDPTTRRIVSSQPVVQDGGVSLQWLAAGVLAGLSSTATLGNSGGFDLVLSPPSGAVGLPEFADSYVGQTNESYPPLPKPVTISGTVLSPAQKAVSASLHFVSTALYNYSASPSSPQNCTVHDSNANLLHYDVVVATEDRLEPGGPVGKYSVVLPQGQYTITVDPDPTSMFAKAQIGALADASSGLALPSADDGCEKTEGSYDILVEPLLSIAGMVSIADGRPLVNATVDLTPTASLLTSSLPQLAQVDWPRPFEVMTGPDGSFSASVDPGMYDVTVRPVDGTRFPWIVSPAHLFSNSTTLDHLYVPAPAPLGVTLHDPLGDNPIAQAVVRAYAFASCTALPGGAPCNGVALQIGQGFTDENGSFQMFLSPIPFTPENR